jgi:hypothetical protein
MGNIIRLPIGNRRTRSPEFAATDIYEGQELIGSLVERPNGQIEAAPTGQPSLGLYTSPQAAVHALLTRRRA